MRKREMDKERVSDEKEREISGEKEQWERERWIKMTYRESK